MRAGPARGIANPRALPHSVANHREPAMSTEIHDRAQFTAMTEGTQEDWSPLAPPFVPFAPNGGARVLEHLKLLDGDYGGFPVDRLSHCLQTATRAHRDGHGEDYVVMALIHDI